MNPSAAKFVFGVGIVLLFLLSSDPLRAQDDLASLSGAITDSSGKALPNAAVSLKNLASGQSVNAQSDAYGIYRLNNLAPGDYDVSASADGIRSSVAKVTLTARSSQTLNLSLTTAPAISSPATPPGSLPDAPSSSKAPSLDDLGFPAEASRGNAKEQALLDKRTHMLKIHQRMGLITTAPLLATLIISVNAGGKSTSTTSRDVHTALGAVTADLYGITAYYAIRAPRVPGTETRGPIRVHKILAWIHGPGMILTPILGAIAYNQKSNGEKVHGIASAHGPVAIVTAGAFAAALVSVSVKF